MELREKIVKILYDWQWKVSKHNTLKEIAIDIEALLKPCHPKDICDVCWTSSWASAREGTPNAQKVKGKNEWVICQLCKAERNLLMFVAKEDREDLLI